MSYKYASSHSIVSVKLLILKNKFNVFTKMKAFQGHEKIQIFNIFLCYKKQKKKRVRRLLCFISLNR